MNDVKCNFAPILVVVSCALGCSAPASPSSPAPAGSDKGATSASSSPQHIELFLDEKRVPLTEDPKITVVVAATVRPVAGAPGGIALSVLDKAQDLGLSVFASTDVIAPGTYKLESCGYHANCDEARDRVGILLSSYPPAAQGKVAYDYPKLGLLPGRFTVSTAESSSSQGIGPCTHLVGMIDATVADVKQHADNSEYVAGPTVRVTATFDVCAIPR